MAQRDDLFAAAAAERLARHAPLADRLRPTSLDEIVGQERLLGRGAPLRSLIETDRLSSVIFWGPPGTGKTTIAKVVARVTSKAFEQLSAVSAGVKDVREVLERADRRLGEQDLGTILFLDFSSLRVGVRYARPTSHLVVWDTPPRRVCTPH